MPSDLEKFHIQRTKSILRLPAYASPHYQ